MHLIVWCYTLCFLAFLILMYYFWQIGWTYKLIISILLAIVAPDGSILMTYSEYLDEFKKAVLPRDVN
jgi:hypothetical protein